MWRFGFSKWRWPNELACVGWFGRQRSARTTCPGKEEGVGRWWRGTALSVAVSVWTLPHLSSRCCIFRLVSVVRSQFRLFLPYRVPVSMMPKTLCPPPLAQARCNPKQEVQPLKHFPLFHSFHSEALVPGHDLPGHSFCHFVGFDGSMWQSKDWICVLSGGTMAGWKDQWALGSYRPRFESQFATYWLWANHPTSLNLIFSFEEFRYL